MELMDEFSQQLKLEGRSEEILLDYRLALIEYPCSSRGNVPSFHTSRGYPL
jgi:hypothetical protein